ncbi:uncharacterized protein N7458_008616 [Penicillium daleae]|uniref:Uncharacterized protein n=1 Tax=Penicillium daleae TaxID=63821 RepID=A0AAD6G1C6_9EURO|nr:uncharacterized protein N7458_008616 [Penicillium daleae]KAJ5444744.1 hypothetical protein N7458_008616 [Penicillium daleae]
MWSEAGGSRPRSREVARNNQGLEPDGKRVGAVKEQDHANACRGGFEGESWGGGASPLGAPVLTPKCMR